MTQPTILYGASDDLIEVDGAIRDEFNVHDTTDVTITLTDHGTVTLRFTFGYTWAIEALDDHDGIVEIIEADEDGDNYTLPVDDHEFTDVSAYSQVAVIRIPVTSVAARVIR